MMRAEKIRTTRSSRSGWRDKKTPGGPGVETDVDDSYTGGSLYGT